MVSHLTKADFEATLRRQLDEGEDGRAGRQAIPLQTWVRLGLGSAFTDCSTLGMPAAGRKLVLEQPKITITVPVQKPAQLRILHLSDFHLRSGQGLVKRLIRIIDHLDYDLALLGGDFADTTAGRQRAIELMRRIDAPLGAFAVPGNHDRFRYNYPNSWRARALTRRGIPTLPGIRISLDGFVEQMEDAGVRLLINESVPISLPEGEVWLLGLDDRASGFDDLAATMRDVPDGAAGVMLTHSPDVWLDAAAAGVALVLAGHTHGGQVLLPKIGALIKRTTMPINPPCGHFRIGDSQLYVSRGAGHSLPLRINCPPELTLIDLHLKPANPHKRG